MSAARTVAGVFAFAVLLAARGAGADTADDASQAFRAATEAHERGDYRAAARSFEEANHLAPHPSAVYNAGRSWEAAGERARAADAYSQILDAGELAAPLRQTARLHLTRLEADLGQLDVSGSPALTVSVAHVEGAPAPLRCHLAPGHYEVHLTSADGRSVTRSIDVVARGTTALVVDLEAGPRVAAPLPAEPAAKGPGDDKPRATVWSRGRTAGFVALGASAIFAGTAVVLGVETLRARDEYDGTNHTDAAARDRTIALRAWTNVAWAASALAAATGVTLLITSRAPSSTSRPGPSTGVRIAGTTASFGLTF